jgi:hypothetical protein
MNRGCLQGFEGREPGPGKPLQFIVKAETWYKPVAACEKTATGHLQIVNRTQAELSCQAVPVQRRCRYVRNLYVPACEFQQGIAGIFGVRQRNPGKDVGDRLKKSGESSGPGFACSNSRPRVSIRSPSAKARFHCQSKTKSGNLGESR